MGHKNDRHEKEGEIMSKDNHAAYVLEVSELEKEARQHWANITRDIYGDIATDMGDGVAITSQMDTETALHYWLGVSHSASLLAMEAAALANSATALVMTVALRKDSEQRWWAVTNRAGDTMTVQAASPKEAAEIAGEKLGDDLTHIGHGTRGGK